MAGEGASQNLQTNSFVDDGRRRRAAAKVERTDLAVEANKRSRDGQYSTNNTPLRKTAVDVAVSFIFVKKKSSYIDYRDYESYKGGRGKSL